MFVRILCFYPVSVLCICVCVSRSIRDCCAHPFSSLILQGKQIGKSWKILPSAHLVQPGRLHDKLLERCRSRALETASVDLCESPLVILCGNIFFDVCIFLRLVTGLSDFACFILST